MSHRKPDKYGRGSAALNGAGFVDLAPGDTFDITKDAESERTPRGAMSKDLNAAPFQNLASFAVNSIAYYVGECNRTCPEFVNRSEPFSIERAAQLLAEQILIQESSLPCPPSTSNLKPETSNPCQS